jgi:hypothetical protein
MFVFTLLALIIQTRHMETCARLDFLWKLQVGLSEFEFYVF